MNTEGLVGRAECGGDAPTSRRARCRATRRGHPFWWLMPYDFLAAVACSKLAVGGPSGLVVASPGLPRGNVKNWRFVACSCPARCADPSTQSETRWSKPLPPRLSNSPLVLTLARAMLAGDATVDGIKDRCARTLGHEWRWLGPLARRYLKEYAGQTRPRRRDVVAFLAHDAGFAQTRRVHGDKLRVVDWLGEPQEMQPVNAARAWGVAQIATVGELAEWLDVEASELEWFAGPAKAGPGAKAR